MNPIAKVFVAVYFPCFYFLFWVFMTLGCQYDEDSFQISQTILNANSCIDNWADTVFIASTHSITQITSGYIICDNKSKHLLLIDTNLKLKQKISMAGRGPGEFMMPIQTSFDGQNIAVLDIVRRKLLRFSVNGDYIDEVDLRHQPRLGRFAINDHEMYFSNPLKTHAIIKLNKQGETINAFAESLEDLRSDRHLIFNSENELFSIQISTPIIERFDAQDQLIETYSLVKHPDVLAGLKYVAKIYEAKGNPYSSLSIPIVKDVCIWKQKLFLLIKTMSAQVAPIKSGEMGGESIEAKTVFVIDTRNKMKLVRVIELSFQEEKKDYTSICISHTGDSLIAYNYLHNDICVFELYR